MREKFIEYAEKLKVFKDLKEIYTELANIFNDIEMYHEKGACLEKLWHVTKDDDLYKSIGDVFMNEVRNKDVAVAAYNRYLQFTQPDFFKNYSQALVSIGYERFRTENDNEDYSREIIKLCDISDAIIFMMKALSKMNDYEGVFILEKYMDEISTEIEEYQRTHTNEVNECIEENENSKKHLSEVLAENSRNDDINYLALKLNPKNEQAYLNVIENNILNNNYEDATDLYMSYSERFDKPKKYNIVDVCWEISDHYRDRYEFYKAVLFQKKALEQEL